METKTEALLFLDTKTCVTWGYFEDKGQFGLLRVVTSQVFLLGQLQ